MDDNKALVTVIAAAVLAFSVMVGGISVTSMNGSDNNKVIYQSAFDNGLVQEQNEGNDGWHWVEK